MDEWERILRQGFESKQLDYKAPCAWDEGDKKPCCEIVKDILAIANARGGWIVVGVSETSTGFAWDGLTEQQCESFETSRLNRFLQNYADPPINTHVIKYPSEDKNFVIIEIPRFPDTPHICQKDYPGVLAAGALYVRTDNNESAPIKSSADMRAIVEQATRNRADQLLASFRAVLTSTPQPVASSDALERFDDQVQDARARCEQLIPQDAQDLGFRETVFHPLTFDRLRFTIADLEQMAEAASVDYRGWVYMFYTLKRADLIRHLDDALEMTLNEAGRFQFWHLYRSGCLYVNEMFQEDEHAESRPKRVLGTLTFAYTCTEAVQCLVNLYAGRLADDETVRLQMRLRGVQNRTLASIFGNSYCPMPWKCNADQIVYEQQRALADWRAAVVPHAFEILKFVNQRFGAPEPSYNEVTAAMQRLLNRQL